MVHRRRRDSARVIVLDERGHVLLVRIVDPFDDGPPVWLTPGGGIEAEETLVQAARRELREETGLVVTEDLGDPVAVTRGDWAFREELLTSEDTFFLLRTVRYEPNVEGQQALEVEIHDCWRWWSVDELGTGEEVVLPGGLAELLEVIEQQGRSKEPISLPWLVP